MVAIPKFISNFKLPFSSSSSSSTDKKNEQHLEMDNRNKEPTNPGDPPLYAESQFKRFRIQDLLKKKYIVYWVILAALLVLTALMTIYHDQIINWLKPVSKKIRGTTWGWLIPIIVLTIISFPPLFGHEIVGILCGVVYGFWIGFGIVAAGTFIGEISTYYAFKGLFRNYAEKLERTNLNYNALARVTRDGGFYIVFLVRLSAIPSHFSTAVFATCGVSFWSFFIATLVTLPKQMTIVYLGVIIENPKSGKTVSNVVLALSFVLTVAAAGYVWWKMRIIRPKILAEEQDRLKQSKEYQGAGGVMAGGVNNAQDPEEINSPLLHQQYSSSQPQQQRIGEIRNIDNQDGRPSYSEEYRENPYGYNNDAYQGIEVVEPGHNSSQYEPFRTVVAPSNGGNGGAVELPTNDDRSYYGREKEQRARDMV